MSYLCYLWESSCLIYVICGRVHVLFMLFVGEFMSYLCCLWESSCLIYVVCGRVHVLFMLFVGEFMSYLCCLRFFGCSDVPHHLTISVAWRVSYKKQKLLALCNHPVKCSFLTSY